MDQWKGSDGKGACHQGNDLSVIPETHMKKGKNGFLQVVFSLYMCTLVNTQ